MPSLIGQLVLENMKIWQVNGNDDYKQQTDFYFKSPFFSLKGGKTRPLQ